MHRHKTSSIFDNEVCSGRKPCKMLNSGKGKRACS